MLRQQRDITNLKDLVLARVKRLPIYVAAFFIASHYFSIQVLITQRLSQMLSVSMPNVIFLPNVILLTIKADIAVWSMFYVQPKYIENICSN